MKNHAQEIFKINQTKEVKSRLNESKFKQFISGEMSISEAKIFETEVNERFFFIVPYYFEALNQELDYFCYPNATENNNIGHFDISNSNRVDVEYQLINQNNDYHHFFIDTSWFYRNFDQDILQIIHTKEVENEQRLQQEQKQKEKIYIDTQRLKNLQESIRSKLTEEELLTLSFLNVKQFQEKEIAYNKSNAKKRFKK